MNIIVKFLNSIILKRLMSTIVYWFVIGFIIGYGAQYLSIKPDSLAIAGIYLFLIWNNTKDIK